MENPIISNGANTFMKIREIALEMYSISFDIFLLDDITL